MPWGRIKTILLLTVISWFSFTVPAIAQAKGATVQPVKKKLLTIKGSFKSTMGVMTPLSCYCGNGGTVTTAAGKEIKVCFESTNREITCSRIRIRGYYFTKANNPEPTSPCPKGEMTYFKVVSYTCN